MHIMACLAERERERETWCILSEHELSKGQFYHQHFHPKPAIPSLENAIQRKKNAPSREQNTFSFSSVEEKNVIFVTKNATHATHAPNLLFMPFLRKDRVSMSNICMFASQI
jgi:hypothetical protein